MYSKEDIFNLSLSALKLQRRITNADTDQSNEAKVLRSVWTPALNSTLQDLNLDSTADVVELELIDSNPNKLWQYVYKYPTDCAFFRRIRSCVRKDSRRTHIARSIGMYEGEKGIFTNEYQALGDYISNNVPLSALSATAGLAMSVRLALLASPLVTGKGATALLTALTELYKLHKAEAQEQDRLENFNYDDPWVESEFAATRLE